MSRVVADAIDVLVVMAGVLIGYLGVGASLFVLRPLLFRWPAPSALDLAVWTAAALVLYLDVVVAWSGSMHGSSMPAVTSAITDGRSVMRPSAHQPSSSSISAGSLIVQ